MDKNQTPDTSGIIQFKSHYGYTQAVSLGDPGNLKRKFELRAIALNLPNASFEIEKEGIRCDFQTAAERNAWDRGEAMLVPDCAYQA